MFKPHPDKFAGGNKIIRHYNKDKSFLDLSVDESIARGLNKWEGWKCAAGQLYLYVGFDGDVYAGNCRIGGKLGNVFSDFTLPEKWITCTNEFCGCGGDLLVPKIYNENASSYLRNYRNKTHRGPSKRTTELVAPVAVETAFSFDGLRVQWDIGRRCNFNCSYCWPGVHSSTEELKSYEVLQTAGKVLLEKFGKGKKIAFQFGGGEPTIYPKFLNWVMELKKLGHDIVLTSNGSRNVEYWAKMIQYASINISVHFESANLDRLYKNFETMTQCREDNPNCGFLEVKLMCPPGVVEKAKVFRDRILKIPNFSKHAAWSLVPIRFPSIDKRLAATMVTYNDRELQILQQQL